MGDLPALEDGKYRSSQPDQRAAAHRRRPLRQRLELQPGAAVVEQDAAVEVAHHHRHRQLRHQRGQPVFLFFDSGLGQPDLLLDIGQQLVALLCQIVGGPRQFAHFGRAFGRDAEVAIGAEHQAQGFGHAQQAMDILLEQAAQQDQPGHEAEKRHQPAQRQARQQEFGKRRALGVLCIGEQQDGGKRKGARHQQAEDARGNDETEFRFHASSDLIWSTRSLVENGLVM
ncbi:hypothetical protein [Sulfuritalea hydrogenivorans]|uniref:Uncharacterized protein n=1 Tax=Sulfuritalea hydrogenivorans sk43H TaxID=1223802 RepID=W0SJA0_9PROT|nr:hypothetical protein [Sulfuritalea hydrogenivorans]BAO30093.1 hypothetical protein SUTH_02303 [Sulfuritalea hydrogenivorans sk43H]